MAFTPTWTGVASNVTVGGTPANSRLEKTSGATGGHDGVAISNETITGAGYIEYVVPSTAYTLAVGLSSTTSAGLPMDILLAYNGTAIVSVYSGSTYLGDFSWVAGETIRHQIYNESGTWYVRYLRNGVQQGSAYSLGASEPTYRFDVAISTLNAYISNASMEDTGASTPSQASNPFPATTATNVSTATVLGWSAGANATSHRVLFGTVNPPPEVVASQAGTSYNPGPLQPNTTYYWRIDELNSLGTTTGTVWSFTTGTGVGIVIKVHATGGLLPYTYPNTQLQQAMDAAQPGDRVLVQKNFSYVATNGPFLMRQKAGATTWTTLETGVNSDGSLMLESEFPAAGVRMTPAAASGVLAKLKVYHNEDACLQTPWNTKPEYWKIRRLEFNPNAWGGDTLIRVGWDGKFHAGGYGQTVAMIPQHFVFDQVYVKGDTLMGQFRGISIHANDVTVTNSYFEDIKSLYEGQVVWANSSQGPIHLENNHFSGGCETLITGGSGSPEVDCVVAASPAPTLSGARFSTVQDLSIGQGVTITTSTGQQYAEIATMSGLDVTFSTPLTSVPTVGGSARWGVVIQNMTVRKNVFTRPSTWRTYPDIDPVGSPTATPSTTGGSLTAGTYYFRVAAYRMTVRGLPVASANSLISATVASGSTGSINITWTAPASPGGVTFYRVYGTTSTEPRSFWEFNAPATSFLYTGQTPTRQITGIPYDEDGYRHPDATVGRGWFVKNTVEWKQVNGLLLEGNVIENSWIDGQAGALMLLAGTTQAGANPSAHVRNVTVRYNIFRNGAQWLQMSGRDILNHQNGRAKVFNFHDNLVYDIGTPYGSDRVIIIVGGTHNSYNPDRGPSEVTFNHNTVVATGHNSPMALDLFRSDQYQPIPAFIVTNNIFFKGTYGLAGYGAPGGAFTEGLWTPFTGPGSTWNKNIIADLPSLTGHPTGTENPTTSALNTSTFTNAAIDDYSVKNTSPYYNTGTDGKSYGADLTLVYPLTNIALSGDNSGVGASAPTKATAPSPVDGATGVSVLPLLSWSPGDGATGRFFRFGTTNPPPLIAEITGSSSSIPVGPLQFSTQYFWRVDEKNATGTTTGDVWDFTTEATPNVNRQRVRVFIGGVDRTRIVKVN